MDFDGTVGEVSEFFEEFACIEKRSPTHQARLIVNYANHHPRKANVTQGLRSGYSKVNFQKMQTKGLASTVLTEESEEADPSSYGEESSVSKFNPLTDTQDSPSMEGSPSGSEPSDLHRQHLLHTIQSLIYL